MKESKTYNSWTIVSDTCFLKQMDKSTFHHHGTGIPKSIQSYWDIDNMEQSSKKAIQIRYNDQILKAYIYCDPKQRTRLHWYSDLRNIIHEKYYELSILYKEQSQVDQSPIMQFKKIRDNYYELDLVDLHIEDSVDGVNEQTTPYEKDISEGKVFYTYSKKFERNPKIRKQAIDYHGVICHACGFEFEKKYGELGKGYIEIHHNKPLYKNGSEVNVDIENDLTPVCSNCHRMLHRQRHQVLSVESLKEVIV